MKTCIPAPDSPEAFARRFRLLMSYHDLTLGDIAAATRSATSTVGTWKNGRIPSSMQALAKLAEIFHVRVEYLLAGQVPCGGRGAAHTKPTEAKGRGGHNAADLAARRLLDELECLLLALEPSPVFAGNGHTVAMEEDASGDGAGCANISAGAKAIAAKSKSNPSPPSLRTAGGGRGAATTKGLRRQVDGYVRAYLDRAEREPGGLAHAWVQLRREFPLDLYEQLR